MQDYSCSPVFLLASFLFQERGVDPSLFWITGPSGSGKTHWCLELIEKARERGAAVSGLVSPPVFVAGRKTGIDLVDLSSGERRRLAVLRRGCLRVDELATDDWQFDPEVLAWGNQVLERLLDESGQKPGDLLILDELGPLEFHRSQGLVNGMRLIAARQFRLTCCVIRPGLLSAAMERCPWGQVVKVRRKSLPRAEEQAL